MTQYLLVAVSHGLTDGPNDNLLSPACMARFKSEIVPLLSNKSLLVCEGFDSEHLITSAHPRYDLLHDSLVELPDSLNPSFGGFDIRQSDDYAVANRYASRLDEWETVCKNTVATNWAKKPETIEEVLDDARSGTHVARLKREPSPQEKELARWVRVDAKKFDRHNLEGIRKHGRRHDVCMFIGGSVHVIAMAIKSGYPIKGLVEAADVPNVYFSYHSTYTWTRLFLEH